MPVLILVVYHEWNVIPFAPVIFVSMLIVCKCINKTAVLLPTRSPQPRRNFVGGGGGHKLGAVKQSVKQTTSSFRGVGMKCFELEGGLCFSIYEYCNMNTTAVQDI